MTDALHRADLLLKEFVPYCERAVIVTATDKHWQFRIKRKVESAPSGLFSDDTTNNYPFDDWALRQGAITWTTKGTYWIGHMDGVKITIRVE